MICLRNRDFTPYPFEGAIYDLVFVIPFVYHHSDLLNILIDCL